ncbi:MAG: anhydro-N-acetylmuramic acid kinase [Bacteroidetes bacterium]|nr:anhydro-N-acetylmuramic acid kinase [Bacteroidota bacterium]
MSGSSLDGLDIAYCQLDLAWEGGVFYVKNWELLFADTLPFTVAWQHQIEHLPSASASDFCRVHATFGHYLGKLVNQFFEKNKLDKATVDIIASHGHTIFHEPAQGFTVQIGDGAALASATGCKVVCDFRTADVALGGQGAPLAPMADKMLFPDYDFYLNLGGIANITYRNASSRFIAFDVCGANQALNALAKLLGQPFDAGGQLAASGKLDLQLWENINGQDFFDLPYPKSLSNQWVQQNLTKTCLEAHSSVPDRLHTVCEHVGFQLAKSIRRVLEDAHTKKDKYRLLATGGGVFNSYLVHCIQQRLPDIEIVIPTGNVVKFKEALLMALLGVMRIESVPNCMSSVTGARKDAIGGGIYE